MTLEEFAKLTGFKPDQEYYHAYIEPRYLESDLDKRDWCKQWVKKGGIQNVYNDLNEMYNVSKKTYGYYFGLYRKISDDYDKLLKERDDAMKRFDSSKKALDAVIEKLNYLYEQHISEKDALNALINKLIEVKIL